jgi:alpha-beta hydrolase superfamily lysophospholipase
MDHEYISSEDGTKLHVVRWAAEGAPRGDVLLSHGLAEHAGRYQHVAEALSKGGYDVAFLELRGHGDSEGKRGHVQRWSRYAEDLHALAAHVGRPAFVVAHSMGGLVALDATRLGWPTPVLGLVLTNPLLGVAVDPPAWKTTLATVLSSILPALELGNEIDPLLLTHDLAVVEAYRNDARVFHIVTPRWFSELNAAIERVTAAAPNYRTPLLLLTSTGDRICNPAIAALFAGRYGAEIEHRVLPDLYHEILNEPEKDRILASILTWLGHHAPQPTPEPA